MTTWYLAKISIQQELENGTLATVKESYLIDAVSYTEAETKAYEIVANNTSDFVIDSLVKKKLSDVFDSNGEEVFYEAKIQYTTINESSGKEKVISDSVLLSADSFSSALELLGKEFSTMLVPYEVISIAKTPILEVVRHVGERPYVDKTGRGSLIGDMIVSESEPVMDSF